MNWRRFPAICPPPADPAPRERDPEIHISTISGGTHLHGDVHDHQQSDARNHLHVPGPRVGTAGIHQLE